MLKELIVLISVGGQLIVPLVEITVNVWNVYNVNEMIKDPDSGYGEEFIFEEFFREIDPWIPLVTSPIGEKTTGYETLL